MVNKEEVIIMTKLAIYDKKYGVNDKKANDLYYNDYVYRKNFYARTLALVGCFIVILFYTVKLLLSEDPGLFIMSFRLYVVGIVIFIFMVMFLYTAISTKISTKEYKNIKTRLKSYFLLIKELEALKEKKDLNTNEYETNALNSYLSDEELKIYYGSTTRNKRRDY